MADGVKRRSRSVETAAEFVARLERDPEYQERRRRQDQELARIAARRREEERPVLDALRAAGIEVEERFDEIVELLRDRTLGAARIGLVSTLTRSRNPHRHRILEELASDPDLNKEIAAKMKAIARGRRSRSIGPRRS